MTAPIPTIKPRLEELIQRTQHLCQRIDQHGHTILGDGSPDAAQPANAPYTIPDQLQMLEDLVRQATDRISSIAERF